MRFKTSVIALFLALILVALMFSACSQTLELDRLGAEDRVRLSSLNVEECKAFLTEQGVTIPENLSNFDFPSLFADLEKDPDMSVVVGWTPVADLIDEIRDVVKDYYGIHTT